MAVEERKITFLNDQQNEEISNFMKELKVTSELKIIHFIFLIYNYCDIS